MALTPIEKSKIMKGFAQHEKDTGSAEVQIALFTEEIERLSKHLKSHLKDNHSRRGLLKMVHKRKRVLDFLKTESPKRYEVIIKKLGLRS